MKEETHLVIIEVLATAVDNLSRKSNKYENENFKQSSQIMDMKNSMSDTVVLIEQLSKDSCDKDAEISRLKEENDGSQYESLKSALGYLDSHTHEEVLAGEKDVTEYNISAKQRERELLDTIDKCKAKATKATAEKRKLLSLLKDKNISLSSYVLMEYDKWQKEQRKTGK